MLFLVEQPQSLSDVHFGSCLLLQPFLAFLVLLCLYVGLYRALLTGQHFSASITEKFLATVHLEALIWKLLQSVTR